MGSDHTDFAALDAAIADAQREANPNRVLRLVRANLSDASGAPHLLRYVAEALIELDHNAEAAQLYGALADYAIDLDRPLDAVFLIDALANRQPAHLETLLDRLATRYAADAPDLQPGRTPVALPTDGAIMVDPVADDAEPQAVRIESALTACGAVLELDREAGPASPIPLLSDLGPDDFTRVLLQVESQLAEDGHVLIQPGQPVEGLWWLARGGLTVHSPDQGTRALNGPNILLGLEYLSGQPSAIQVTCLGRCDLVFLDGQTLDQLMSESAPLERAVRRLVGRYELHQAVSRCPLFRLLPLARHRQLLAQFSAHRIPAGQALMRQSAPSPGLFILTRGQVDLQVENGDASRIVAQLQPGDLLGLMGLEDDAHARLYAIAREGASVLFLERDRLLEHLQQHPEVASALARLGAERAALVAMSL